VRPRSEKIFKRLDWPPPRDVMSPQIATEVRRAVMNFGCFFASKICRIERAVVRRFRRMRRD
jgi:hypothetical protein